MTNDLIRLACERASRKFGDARMFNSACFGTVFATLAGVSGGIDGKIVRAMLTGRDDIEVLSGGCHFRMLDKE